MLCLHCWHWWPTGSRYCGVCQRSLNARLCPEGHANALWGPQQTCNTCNQPLFQPGAPGLSMGWITRGGVLVALVCIGWQAVLHLNGILSAIWQAMLWLLCQCLCHIPPGVYRGLENLAAWWITLYLLSYLLPPAAGGRLRAGLVRVVQVAFRTIVSVLALLGRAAFGVGRWCARSHRHIDTEQHANSGRHDPERRH